VQQALVQWDKDFVAVGEIVLITVAVAEAQAVLE
jgi:hypothetical protein